jgi:hypothetical protein
MAAVVGVEDVAGRFAGVELAGGLRWGHARTRGWRLMRYLPMILIIVLMIYCWVEIAMSDPRQVRQLPRGLWTIIVLAPLVGAVSWLVFGRPNGTEVVQPISRPRPRQVAPDDDVDFLRTLRSRPRPPDDTV